MTVDSSLNQSTARRGCANRARGGVDLTDGVYIGAIVVAFVLFWPAGVALLAWALWRDQIKAWPWFRKTAEIAKAPPKGFAGAGFGSMRSKKPDNTMLAEYLERERERLRAEQDKLDELVKAFEAFKEAERRSADRRDFEAFLRQREGGDAAGADDFQAPERPAGRPA
ncbi:MAG: DUF2852 domain-containing protein [Lautropia sp.]